MATEQKFADDKYIRERLTNFLHSAGIKESAEVNKELINYAKLAPSAEASRSVWQRAYIVLKSQGKLGDDALDIRPKTAKGPKVDKAEKEAKKKAAYAVSLTAVESNVASQVRAQMNAQRSVSDGTSIVKIIKARPDLADVLPDVNSAEFVYNQAKAADKIMSMDAEKQYVTPDTLKNFETLYDQVSSGKPIKAVTSAKSSSWIGLQISKPDGTTPVLDKEGLSNFLIYEAAGYINSSDESKPGLKLKRVSNKNSKTGKQSEGFKTSIALSNTKAIKNDPDSFYVTATDVDKAVGVADLRTARSELSYSVFVYKDGVQQFKAGEAKEPKVRVKRVSGQIKCYGTKHSATYWIPAFEKKKGTKKTKTKTGVTDDDLNMFVSLKAKQIVSDKEASSELTFGESAVSPDIIEKLANYSYSAGNDTADTI
jgi:hypothetical protein